MRPNQVRASTELIQLSVIRPTAGPKYSAAQIAASNAATEIASLMKPLTIPMITDTAMARTMRMSMIGIGDVGSARAGPGWMDRDFSPDPS